MNAILLMRVVLSLDVATGRYCPMERAKNHFAIPNSNPNYVESLIIIYEILCNIVLIIDSPYSFVLITKAYSKEHRVQCTGAYEGCT
jgi:hypothetical protein